MSNYTFNINTTASAGIGITTANPSVNGTVPTTMRGDVHDHFHNHHPGQQSNQKRHVDYTLCGSDHCEEDDNAPSAKRCRFSSSGSVDSIMSTTSFTSSSWSSVTSLSSSTAAGTPPPVYFRGPFPSGRYGDYIEQID